MSYCDMCCVAARQSTWRAPLHASHAFDRNQMVNALPALCCDYLSVLDLCCFRSGYSAAWCLLCLYQLSHWCDESLAKTVARLAVLPSLLYIISAWPVTPMDSSRLWHCMCPVLHVSPGVWKLIVSIIVFGWLDRALISGVAMCEARLCLGWAGVLGQRGLATRVDQSWWAVIDTVTDYYVHSCHVEYIYQDRLLPVSYSLTKLAAWTQ